MKPTKTFILRHKHPISHEYAAVAAKSCDDVGIKWQYFNGYTNMIGKDAWVSSGIKMPWKYSNGDKPLWVNEQDMLEAHKANCASAGHGALWKKIAQGPDEAAIILEHDALLLNPVDIDIPDFHICVLGYKVKDPTKYDHVKAGSPDKWISIDGHEGAHAYAITKKTAAYLVEEIEQYGVLGAVDNAYFIRGQRKTRIPLLIASSPPAIGWLRESTIWKSGSATNNYRFIDGFQRFYKE